MLSSEKQRQLGKLKILEKKLFHSSISGDYRSFVNGSGFDFLQLREYHDGDDIRFLNWNAFAKTGKLLIKETQPERDRAIIIVFDCSASSKYSSTISLKSDVMLELALSFSWLASSNKDNLGFLAFDDKSISYLPCSKNKQQFFSIFNLATERLEYSHGTSLQKPLEYLLSLKQSKSIVFFISDFISEDFFKIEKQWAILSKKHIVIPVLVVDDLEKNLEVPEFLIDCEDLESNSSATFEFSLDLKNYLQQRHEEQLQFFLKKELRPLLVGTGDDVLKKIISFFYKK
jgi:uncharacterized protein (DUF58 family)